MRVTVQIYRDLPYKKVRILISNETYYLNEDGDYVEYRPGDMINPYLSLDEDLYAELAKGIIEFERPNMPDPELIRESLDDTRVVRDRLLAIVERITP